MSILLWYILVVVHGGAMFSGSTVALVTPFRKDGAVDLKTLMALVERQVAAGTDAVSPCGTTGEALTLSEAERAEVIRSVVAAVRGRIPVVAGAGSPSTAEAVRLAKGARAAGADALLVSTPAYNKPTQEGLYRHFAAIARAVPIPMMLYNVPGRTGVNLEPVTVARLSRLRSVVAIKEASGSMSQAGRILASCTITVLSGDDALAVPMMAIGAKGVVSVAANLAPREVKAMTAAAARGDFRRAAALHRKLTPLFEACFLASNPIPVKAMLAMQGLLEPVWRLPMCAPSRAVAARLRRAVF